jgi:hypothetical protein
MPDEITLAAARIFKVPLSHVTSEMRSRAKAITYSGRYSKPITLTAMPNYRKQHIRQFRYLLKNFETAARSDEQNNIAGLHPGVIGKFARDNYLLQREMLLTFFKNVIGETSNEK